MIEVRRDAVSVARLSRPRGGGRDPPYPLGSLSHDDSPLHFHRITFIAECQVVSYLVCPPWPEQSRGRTRAGVAVDAQFGRQIAVLNNASIETLEFELASSYVSLGPRRHSNLVWQNGLGAQKRVG